MGSLLCVGYYIIRVYKPCEVETPWSKNYNKILFLLFVGALSLSTMWAFLSTIVWAFPSTATSSGLYTHNHGLRLYWKVTTDKAYGRRGWFTNGSSNSARKKLWKNAPLAYWGDSSKPEITTSEQQRPSYGLHGSWATTYGSLTSAKDFSNSSSHWEANWNRY